MDLINVGFWGFIGSSSLIIGAIVGYYVSIPKKISSSLVALSAGILTSAMCFDILIKSNHYGGLIPTIIGFILGVSIFTSMNILVSRLIFKSKREEVNIEDYSESLNNEYSSFKEIARKFINYKTKPNNLYERDSLISMFSVLIEGIPESIAIGLILIIGGPISIALIISIFLANLFEGLTGTENMKLGKWGKKSIFGVWIFVILLAPLCAMLSYNIFSSTDHQIIAIALGISAGAIISMIADIMLPQSFNETQEYTGVLMALGFLISFVLSQAI